MVVVVVVGLLCLFHGVNLNEFGRGGGCWFSHDQGC